MILPVPVAETPTENGDPWGAAVETGWLVIVGPEGVGDGVGVMVGVGVGETLGVGLGVGLGDGVGVGLTPTAIGEEVPKMVELTTSTALTVLVPTVFKVTGKVPTPFVSVESPGSTAAPSLLVKWTVPE
jgi:hypothetical protein